MYKTVKFSLIVLIFGLMLIPNIQSSFSYNVTFDVTGKKFKDTPVVCAMEPEQNEYLSERFVELLMEETRIAIHEWQALLKRTENKDYKHIWNINYTKILVEEQETFPFEQCRVFISFEEKPPNKEEWYKKVGIIQNEVGDTGRSNVIIYYAAIDFCFSEDEKFYYYDPCYSDEPRLLQQLATVVKHEFGHAIGLGHYKSDDLGVNVEWARGNTPSPSIMAVFTHQNAQENRIKITDIQKVRELYGPSGFLPEPKVSEQSYIESLQTAKPQFVIPKGGFVVATIWGFLNDTSNVVGVPVMVNITKPDGSTEQRIARPSSDEKFQIQFVIDKETQQGTYLIAASYMTGRTQTVTFDVVSGENISTNQTSIDTALWIKNDVKKWVEGKISDWDFVLAVHEMIRIGVILPPKPEVELENIDIIKIPKWVKTTAGWWTEGHVADEDFRNAMRYLVEKGIMII